jgi:hypothetical protein
VHDCQFAEPSGMSRSMLVIRTSRSISSIRVRRISLIASTRIVASIVSTAPIAAFWRAPSGTAEAACTACGRNEEKECSHLQPQPTNDAYWRTDVPQITADLRHLGPAAEILHPFRRRAKMV